ncbi:MAG: hypothetical protein IT354_20380 [Gemmatimonadaceae bacterium]|nr:hypothetical protein [Gemmatimonadaceae bacterium]
MRSIALRDVLFHCAVATVRAVGRWRTLRWWCVDLSSGTAIQLSKPMNSLVLRRFLVLQTIALATFLSSACTGSVPMPSSDISSGQAIIDLGNALGQLREDNALLQADLDSLRAVVAYQDSIVRQLAALSNVSMRPSPAVVP